MAFVDDVVNDITAKIVSIGLSKTSAASGEVSGGSYVPLPASFTPATGGKATLSAPLQFNGPANEGPITHVIFRRDSGVWTVQPLSAPVYFNSDGRLDLTSYEVSAELGA